MLEGKISSLKKEIIEYGSLAEKMIEKSIKGILKRDNNVLTEVIENDEPKANRLEIEIDEHCTTCIAQFEPKARNLRTILMILKISNDLERIADHAVNIAESGLFLVENIPVKPLIDIPRMAELSTAMLKDSITSLINEDSLLARDVCERDNTVDALKEQILRELITFMSSDPNTIARAMHLIRISSNLERIADLSTNICEDVIFMVEGKNIKHHQQDGKTI